MIIDNTAYVFKLMLVSPRSNTFAPWNTTVIARSKTTKQSPRGKRLLHPFRVRNDKRKKLGLTLIELLVTTSILSVLVFTVGFTFITGLKLWNEGYARSDIRTDISQALELVSKNLRQAKSIDALTAGSITFTADLGSGDTSCRVYMYNATDPEPNPPYTKNTYELRWAQGTVTYGSGAVLATNIAKPNPPSSKPFSQNGNLITMDFVVERGDESMSLRTNVQVRNL